MSPGTFPRSLSVPSFLRVHPTCSRLLPTDPQDLKASSIHLKVTFATHHISLPHITRATMAAVVAPQPSLHAPVSNSIKLLFRREVAHMLAMPPHLANQVDADGNPIPVEVVAAVESLAANGQQQAIQLCRSGDVSWVTRTEGDRMYFPRSGRVKRVRDATEDEEDQAPRVAKKAATGKKGKGKKKAEDAPATPGAKKAPAAAAPKAPRKSRRGQAAQEGIPEEDEEMREHDRAARETTAALKERVTDALGRGQRKCKGRADSEFSFTIKAEVADDDLASLCGGVNGLDVRSADSNYAPSVAVSEYHPIASGSNYHGRY